MKWLDLPPVWLAGFLVLSWGTARAVPGLTMAGTWMRWPGAALVLSGLALMVLAVVQMARHRTTVIPHRQPSAMVSTGVFAISRNPIYVGDALILTGATLWWGAILALPLTAVFMWLIWQRFIKPEEAVLHARFAKDFEDWSKTTRRWL